MGGGGEVVVGGAVVVVVMAVVGSGGKWRKGHNKYEKKVLCEHKLLLGYYRSRRFKKINNK